MCWNKDNSLSFSSTLGNESIFKWRNKSFYLFWVTTVLHVLKYQMKSLYTFSYEDYRQKLHVYLISTYLFRPFFYQWPLLKTFPQCRTDTITSALNRDPSLSVISIFGPYRHTEMVGRRVTWVHIAEYRNYNNTWNLTFISYVTVTFTDSVFKCGHDLSVEADIGRTTEILWRYMYWSWSGIYLQKYPLDITVRGK